MSATVVVAVVGTIIAVVGIALIVLFVRRIGAQREQQATQAFFQEPADVYREELNDRCACFAPCHCPLLLY